MPARVHSADLERQLLAPLQALLRDAQALLGVEVDADRLEDAAGAASADSVARPSSTDERAESAPRGMAQPPAASLFTPPRRGAVDSAQRGALPLRTGEMPMKAAVDPAQPGLSSPGAAAAAPVEPARNRFEQSLQSAAPMPPSAPPRVVTGAHGTQATQRGSAIARATILTPLDDADEMAPSANSRPALVDAPSTIGTAPPRSDAAAHAAPAPSTLRSAGSASTQPHVNTPAPLAESLADSLAAHGRHAATAVAAAALPIRPGEPTQAAADRMSSGHGRQAPEAEDAAPAASQPGLALRLSASADALQLQAIPLRPGHALVRSGEGPAAFGPYDAVATPAAAQTQRPDSEPQAQAVVTPPPTAHRHSSPEAETAAPASSQPGLAPRVGASADAQRLRAIPLRPRQGRPDERSLVTPGTARATVRSGDVQAAARRLASAVEPALEQAYRLTQARLDPSAAGVSGRLEPPALVHNSFNITVSLRPDEADTSADPAALADALTEVLRTAARRHGLEI